MSSPGDPTRAPSEPPPVVVLLNPAAGIVAERQDAPSYLSGLFAAADLAATIVLLNSPTHAETAVRSAVASGADTIVAAGGDGTVNRVASTMLDTRMSLGVLPFGTLNHFAKDPAAHRRPDIVGRYRRANDGEPGSP